MPSLSSFLILLCDFRSFLHVQEPKSLRPVMHLQGLLPGLWLRNPFTKLRALWSMWCPRCRNLSEKRARDREGGRERERERETTEKLEHCLASIRNLSKWRSLPGPTEESASPWVAQKRQSPLSAAAEDTSDWHATETRREGKSKELAKTRNGEGVSKTDRLRDKREKEQDERKKKHMLENDKEDEEEDRLGLHWVCRASGHLSKIIPLAIASELSSAAEMQVSLCFNEPRKAEEGQMIV